MSALLSLLLLLSAFPGCTPTGKRALKSQTSGVTLSSTSPSGPQDQSEPERVINPEQFGQTITLQVDQIFRVRPPIDSAQWGVDFDARILEPLNSPEKMRSPGPEGWRFRVRAEGLCDLVFNSIPAAGRAAPMAARISLTIQAIK